MDMKKFITPGKVKQVKASILAPELAGLRLVINACAQNGKFDAPLDALLAKRWSKVREDYKGWYATQHNFRPGSLNSTAVASDTWVVNMLVKDKEGNLSPDALKLAVKKLVDIAKYERASVHVSTLLTREIPELNDLLMTHLVDDGVNVFFYEEPQQ
jgi:hypothetical protein